MSSVKLSLLSLLSGLLLAFSWPAIGDLSFLTFFAFIPLLFVEDQLAAKGKSLSVFYQGYITFFFFNLVTTWWIYFASDWGAVMAVVCNALFMAIVFYLFHLTKKRVGRREGYFALLIYWLAFEYIHLNWDLSWPWLTLGNAFANFPSWVQWYEFTGAIGGSFWILAINILLFQLIFVMPKLERKRPKSLIVSILLLLVVLPFAYSLPRYYNYEEKGEEEEIVVIQPNIDPYNEKFSGMSESDQIDRMIHLARKHVSKTTDFVVAPETAFPMAYWEHELEYIYGTEEVRKLIQDFPQLRFVVGLSTSKLYLEGDELSSTARAFSNGVGYYDNYNTAMQLDNSNMIQLHRKSKLVLGVEKVPFIETFPIMKKLSINLGGSSGGFGTQKQPTVFAGEKQEAVAAPIICYESVYGEYISDYVNQGANLLFIITNDGWWHDTPGYKQHLAYARLRAIEQRRSIARSANTGISAFINQRGEVLQATNWWEEDSIKGNLKVNNEKTIYSSYGDVIGRSMAFIAPLLLLLTFVRGLKKRGVSS